MVLGSVFITSPAVDSKGPGGDRSTMPLAPAEDMTKAVVGVSNAPSLPLVMPYALKAVSDLP